MFSAWNLGDATTFVYVILLEARAVGVTGRSRRARAAFQH